MSPTSILKLNSTAYTPSTDNGTRTHNLDDISVLLSPLSYIGVLVAGEGLEPPSSAYETELETTSSLTRYVVVIKGLEPLTGGLPKPAHETSRCTCITIFVVWGWNRTTGTRRFKSLLYLLSYHTKLLVFPSCQPPIP